MILGSFSLFSDRTCRFGGENPSGERNTAVTSHED